MPSKDFSPEPRPIPIARVVAGVAVLLGLGVSSFGFWLAWRPLGFIMGGLGVLMIGLQLGRIVAGRRS
jgi:hypothetical protein